MRFSLLKICEKPLPLKVISVGKSPYKNEYYGTLLSNHSKYGYLAAHHLGIRQEKRRINTPIYYAYKKKAY